MKEHSYRVYGLNIHSEIELPELFEAKEQEPNVWIKLGKVPEHLPNPSGMGVLYEASPDDFLFKFETIARYRVQNGSLITIEPKESVTPEEIRLFLLGSAIGALLHQRSMLALHGSSVFKGNKGIIFTGISSAGKSTLAAGFHEKGYSVLSDDIAVVGFHNNDEHVIYPGIQHLKLWKDVLYHLKDNTTLKKVRPQVEKYWKPSQSLQQTTPVLLDRILLLSSKNTPGYHYEEIFGADKFNLLGQHTYRVQFVEKLNMSKDHFKNLSRLASNIRLFQVERPYSPLRIKELTDFVENEILQI